MRGRTWREWSKDNTYRSPERWEPRLRPFLEPGEQIKHTFQATSGRRGTRWMNYTGGRGPRSLKPPNPAAMLFGVQTFVVAVTDRAVVLIRTTQWSTPKEVVARLPRTTRLGPLAGKGVITVGGIEMLVWGVSDLDAVRDADREMGYDSPGPPSLWG